MELRNESRNEKKKSELIFFSYSGMILFNSKKAVMETSTQF